MFIGRLLIFVARLLIFIARLLIFIGSLLVIAARRAVKIPSVGILVVMFTDVC